MKVRKGNSLSSRIITPEITVQLQSNVKPIRIPDLKGATVPDSHTHDPRDNDANDYYYYILYHV